MKVIEFQSSSYSSYAIYQGKNLIHFDEKPISLFSYKVKADLANAMDQELTAPLSARNKYFYSYLL